METLELSAGAAGVGARFAAAVGRMEPGRPVGVLGHFDADGLSAMAITARALERAGRTVRTRIVGRGESPWSAEMAAELGAGAALGAAAGSAGQGGAGSGGDLGGLVIADLGVRGTPPRRDIPVVVLDHHVPQAAAAALGPLAEVISGHGMEPAPTTSLLALWSAAALGPAEDLLWLAALGLIGDMAEDAGFVEMAQARRLGITALRKAASLVNAPRRTASGDASAALALLLRENGPKAIVDGASAEAEALRAAKAEVAAALEGARRVAPVVRGGVALIAFASPCQIHPLVAQQWRGRLRGEIVMAANSGYRPGWVHFAVRSARDADLVQWLAARRPAGAGDEYGSGHPQATGGALPAAVWDRFIADLGFTPQQEIAA